MWQATQAAPVDDVAGVHLEGPPNLHTPLQEGGRIAAYQTGSTYLAVELPERELSIGSDVWDRTVRHHLHTLLADVAGGGNWTASYRLPDIASRMAPFK